MEINITLESAESSNLKIPETSNLYIEPIIVWWNDGCQPSPAYEREGEYQGGNERQKSGCHGTIT